MVRAVELAHAPYAAHLHTVSGEKHTRVPVLLAARVAHGVSCRVCCCVARCCARVPGSGIVCET